MVEAHRAAGLTLMILFSATHSVDVGRSVHQNRGSALLAVLWVVAILSMMIFTTVVLVRTDVELSTQQKKAFRATLLAEEGIAIAANPVTRKHDQELLHRQVDDSSRYDVRITGEGGKYNINSLLQGAQPGNIEFLQIIFVSMGMDKDIANDTIKNLIDWTDQDDENAGSASYEKEQYEKEGYLNYPFNRPFYSLDEVLLVRGMTEITGLEPRWRDFFTIYSQGALDINEAEPEVMALAGLKDVGDAQQFYDAKLRAAAGEVQEMDEIKSAREMVESRWGKDGQQDTEDDEQSRLNVEQVAAALGMEGLTDESGNPLTNRITAQDGTVRIESTATVGDFRKRIVIVMRNRTNAPQILNREEVPLFD
jgi:general secretion pathway protein K